MIYAITHLVSQAAIIKQLSQPYIVTNVVMGCIPMISTLNTMERQLVVNVMASGLLRIG